MAGKLVRENVVAQEVLVRDVNGQVQFRIWTEAPPTRIDAELLPLLTRGGTEEGWRAERTGRKFSGELEVE